MSSDSDFGWAGTDVSFLESQPGRVCRRLARRCNFDGPAQGAKEEIVITDLDDQVKRKWVVFCAISELEGESVPTSQRIYLDLLETLSVVFMDFGLALGILASQILTYILY